MVVNKLTIQLSSSKFDVSNYRQSYVAFNNEINPCRIVGYQNARCEAIQRSKLTA